jgi:hypothetical protein
LPPRKVAIAVKDLTTHEPPELKASWMDVLKVIYHAQVEQRRAQTASLPYYV